MTAERRHNVETSFPAEEFRHVVDKELLRAINALAELTVNELKQVISREGTGKKWPGQKYRSSIPYAPPVVQTGLLRNSWQTKLKRITKFTRRYKALRIGSVLDYARFLEFGVEDKYDKSRIKGGQTPGGWRVKPRPYIEESIAITEKKHMDALEASFKKRLKASLSRIRPRIRRVTQ